MKAANGSPAGARPVGLSSHEVLRDTVNKVGAKTVADELKLSPAMVYKWCQPSDGDTASGERNPLDRILAMCEAANSDKPVKWLCERRNGVFVRNTAREFDAEPPTAHMRATQRIVKEFSELLGSLSESDGENVGVSIEQAGRIRRDWEDVKRAAERLVRACERGVFSPGTASDDRLSPSIEQRGNPPERRRATD